MSWVDSHALQHNLGRVGAKAVVTHRPSDEVPDDWGSATGPVERHQAETTRVLDGSGVVVDALALRPMDVHVGITLPAILAEQRSYRFDKLGNTIGFS